MATRHVERAQFPVLQLADFVKLPLEKSGGMIALVDVYCLFNRARGTELISPEDLLQACALWEKLDVYARKNLQMFSALYYLENLTAG